MLPKSELYQVRIAVVIAAALFLVIGLSEIRIAWRTHSVFSFLLGTFFISIAINLWRLKRWAWEGAIACLGIGVLIGVMAPIVYVAAHHCDYDVLVRLYVLLIPFILPAACCCWTLLRYTKQQFHPSL